MPSLVIVESTLRPKIKLNRAFNIVERNDIIYITFKNKDNGFKMNQRQYVEFVKQIITFLEQNKCSIERIQIDYLDRNDIRNNSYTLLLNRSQLDLPEIELEKFIIPPSGDVWK